MFGFFNTNIKKISGEEASKLENVVFLDVRGLDEYKTGHIEDTIHIPLHILNVKAEEILKDKNANIVVYCASGGRSRLGADVLCKLNYKNVYNMGSIDNWRGEVVK